MASAALTGVASAAPLPDVAEPPQAQALLVLWVSHPQDTLTLVQPLVLAALTYSGRQGVNWATPTNAQKIGIGVVVQLVKSGL